MTNLAEFKKGMASLIGCSTNLRPFVCDGSPFNCEVFLVSMNPVTEMSCNFWDFWSNERGFDKYRWCEEYKRTRGYDGTSKTRERINLVIKAAHPINCLETNIYAKTGKSDKLNDYLKALTSEEKERLTANLDFLLEQIKPKLVVALGTLAQKKFLRRRQRQTLETLGCKLWCVYHLRYPNLTDEKACEKAQDLGHRIHEFFYPQP